MIRRLASACGRLLVRGAALAWLGLSLAYAQTVAPESTNAANGANGGHNTNSVIETIPLNDPSAQVLQAFLHCDAQFFSALSQQSDRIEAFKPWLKALVNVPNITPSTANMARIAVPDRSKDDGQSAALTPPYTVHRVPFIEFIDEINVFENKPQTAYYWGFNTDEPLASVLPVLQRLLPLNRKLTADDGTWARIDVYEQGAWRAVAQHSELKGKPAAVPERALIVETHEGGGTRVVCGLQAAPLPASELKKLRPDL